MKCGIIYGQLILDQVGVTMSENEKKKCGRFRKVLKWLLWGTVGFLSVVLLLVATLPLWISPVATGVAGRIVPKFTETDFVIERFNLNPWAGTVRIAGLRLANPDGFGSAPAVSVGSFSLDMSISELFGNVLHVRELLIDDTFASYYSHNGTNNVEVLLANVNRNLSSSEAEKDSAKEEEQKSEIKIIIDHVRISGTRVKLLDSDMIPPMPIVDIELNDIGKKSGGATFAEVVKAFTDALVKGISSVGDGLGALGGLLGAGLQDASSAVGGAATSVKGAAESVGASAATVAADTKSAVKAVGDTATATADGAKAAIDAVGDTAKKAADDVKSLFKVFKKK